jgi:hypothetical protein
MGICLHDLPELVIYKVDVTIDGVRARALSLSQCGDLQSQHDIFGAIPRLLEAHLAGSNLLGSDTLTKVPAM